MASWDWNAWASSTSRHTVSLLTLSMGFSFSWSVTAGPGPASTAWEKGGMPGPDHKVKDVKEGLSVGASSHVVVGLGDIAAPRQ
ncbi:hypothetical protein GCM10023339_66790 [Alloalcanivorax gelatiniphagus]